MDYRSELTVPLPYTFALSTATSGYKRFFCHHGERAGIAEQEVVAVALPGDLRTGEAPCQLLARMHRIAVERAGKSRGPAGIDIRGDGCDIEEMVLEYDIYTAEKAACLQLADAGAETRARRYDIVHVYFQECGEVRVEDECEVFVEAIKDRASVSGTECQTHEPGPIVQLHPEWPYIYFIRTGNDL